MDRAEAVEAIPDDVFNVFMHLVYAASEIQRCIQKRGEDPNLLDLSQRLSALEDHFLAVYWSGTPHLAEAFLATVERGSCGSDRS